MNEKETVPCGLCGKPTMMTGTRRCDGCWELEGRIQRDPALAWRILNQCGDERWLRDHFAGLALASGQASNWRDNDFRPKDGLNIIENTARHAYLIADAMLIARATGA